MNGEFMTNLHITCLCDHGMPLSHDYHNIGQYGKWKIFSCHNDVVYGLNGCQVLGDQYVLYSTLDRHQFDHGRNNNL